jgi:hypothetical protein
MAHVPYLRVFTGEAYYRWTDLVQVLCQRFTQPGARPPWCVVSRPGRQVTRSERDPSQDPTGRWCRHIVTSTDMSVRRRMRKAM